jgi:hypothetical protein
VTCKAPPIGKLRRRSSASHNGCSARMCSRIPITSVGIPTRRSARRRSLRAAALTLRSRTTVPAGCGGQKAAGAGLLAESTGCRAQLTLLPSRAEAFFIWPGGTCPAGSRPPAPCERSWPQLDCLVPSLSGKTRHGAWFNPLRMGWSERGRTADLRISGDLVSPSQSNGGRNRAYDALAPFGEDGRTTHPP